MNLNRDIQSLSNFKRETGKFIEQLKQTGEPVILTINGKAALVVQDTAAYQELLEMRDRFETILEIKAGLESIERGEGRPAQEVFEELFKEFNLAGK